MYTFSAFNYLELGDEKRDQNRRIIELLIDYQHQIYTGTEFIKSKNMEVKKNETYFLLMNFARALNDKFFDISKADHKYDFNADESIAIASLREVLTYGNKVEVLSNDKDISNMLGTIKVVFDNLKPIVRYKNINKIEDDSIKVFKLLNNKKN